MKKLFTIIFVISSFFISVNQIEGKITFDNSLVSSDKSQSKILQNAKGLEIPPRPENAKSGSEFMESIKSLTFSNREQAIKNELLSGNIPNFLRELVEVDAFFTGSDGNQHNIKYWVMPDYLAIGSDSNFCRIPMGPITAQTVADVFGAVMPTRKLVDNIYINSEVKLAPKFYAPIGNENERVEKFILHNSDIQDQFAAANGILGQLVGGIKKDVVLSNKIVDPSRPNHVVIYGWHQLNGAPIQPLTNIHYDYYVDYSHGIRFLDSDILIDGDTVKIQDVLMDPNLYKILSDESGVMSQPTYLFNTKIPSKPSSFGIKSDSDGEVKLLISPDNDVLKYHVYTSKDGLNFNSPITIFSNEFVIDNLSIDSIIYIKLTSENSEGISPESEVLAAIPKVSSQKKTLVVNGFDRTSDGNTYDFIRQHGNSILANGFTFESATNDAILNRLFSLNDYSIVDYILGDESTADESFSFQEQIFIADFLEEGGRLFISGSEIAWDLDYKGSSSDKYFFNNYLKAKYSADAPGGISGNYYSAEGISGNIFEELSQINFDNGTHGTFNVDYADALIPVNGSEAVLNYQNVSVHKTAGISYQGNFGSSNTPGKLIYLGFPFETIYPDSIRDLLMGKVLDFLDSEVSSLDENLSLTPNKFALLQNYPNPFNPNTRIEYKVVSDEFVSIKVLDILGNEVAALVNENHKPGNYEINFNASNLASGVYLYIMNAGNFFDSKKMILLK